MEHRTRTQTMSPAVPRPLGFVMLAVTLASIVLLIFGLVIYVA